MVFGDLSEISESQKRPYAPISDRVLSLLVDLSLFSPIFSLCLSSLLKKLQYRYYAQPDSTEFWALMGLVVLGYATLTIFFQGFLWAVFGATPGQFFFQLRVVRVRDRKPPTLRMAWLRSFLFWFECLFFGLPLLEIFSHSERRALHDRATETEVITLKKQGIASPHPIESKVVGVFFTACLAFFMVWSWVMVSGVYRQIKNGQYKEAQLTETETLCSEVGAREEGSRVDEALGMYLAGHLTSECLSSEVDFAFWKNETSEKAWASFASAVLNEKDKALKRSYLEQACPAEEGPTTPCALGQWWGHPHGSVPQAVNSWTQSILSLQQAAFHRDVVKWEKQLKNLPEDFDLPEYVQVQKIKLLWFQDQSEQARGGYEVLWQNLSSASQKSLASEFCFSEITKECTEKSYSFCRDLEKSMRQNAGEEVKPDWLIALAEEKSCRQASEPNLLELTRDVDASTSWNQLLTALVPESGWSASQRIEELRKVAFASDSTPLIQSRALLHLLKMTHSLSDLEKSQKLLAQDILPYRKELQSLFVVTAQKMGMQTQERLPASENSPEESP